MSAGNGHAASQRKSYLHVYCLIWAICFHFFRDGWLYLLWTSGSDLRTSALDAQWFKPCRCSVWKLAASTCQPANGCSAVMSVGVQSKWHRRVFCTHLVASNVVIVTARLGFKQLCLSRVQWGTQFDLNAGIRSYITARLPLARAIGSLTTVKLVSSWMFCAFPLGPSIYYHFIETNTLIFNMIVLNC